MASLGKTLRNLRKTRRQTLSDVSQATGLSISFLSDIERNVTKPSVDTLNKLSQHYHIVLSELLKDVESDVESSMAYYPPGFEDFEKSLEQQGEQLEEDMRELLLQVESRARRKTSTKEDWLRRYYLLKNEIE